MSGIALTPGALDQLKALAMRAHDGCVYITEINEGSGLRWIEVDVLLTDMGSAPPLHTFRLTPTGAIRRPAPSAPKEQRS